jgi:acyl dehydratase
VAATELRTIVLGPLPEYRVTAHNGSTASENKIHDDTVARQYGFAGGLVPGVTVYAYMTRPAVELFGLRWLEHGAMNARFLKPFYEGEAVTVRAAVVAAGEHGVQLELSAVNESGEICSTGAASLTEPPPVAPDIRSFPRAPLPVVRPDASYEALAAVDALGSPEFTFEPAGPVAAHLAEISDDFPLYSGPDAVAHSGYIVRWANSILVANVRLGPWIHVSSDVTHFSLVRYGDQVSTRGRVRSLFERRGHKFVELNLLMVANYARPVMSVTHTAIYDVRKAGD